MDLHIPILTFLCVAVVVVSNAELSPEIYWKKMLPATPMPIAVKDSLPLSEWTDDKSTSVNVGKGGVNVNTPKQRGGAPTNVNVGPHSGVGVTAGGGNGKGGANVGVGKGGVTVKTGPKKKPVYVGVKPGANPFLYRYAASETQLHDDPNMALFFLEKDMRPESNMRTRLTKGTGGSTFLTREEAKSIPFSSNKMSEILNRFSVQLESKEADSMKETVKECEEKGVEGEEKYCPTSLESMVDYATSKMGKNIKAVSTEASGRNIDKTQDYKITRVRKIRATNNEAIACHKQSYPYAVFYCHKTKATTAYTVSMVGTEGANVNAVAVCHHDTSAWNPKHLAFQVLKVKPGSVPVCHFLPEDHIVWFRN